MQRAKSEKLRVTKLWFVRRPKTSACRPHDAQLQPIIENMSVATLTLPTVTNHASSHIGKNALAAGMQDTFFAQGAPDGRLREYVVFSEPEVQQRIQSLKTTVFEHPQWHMGESHKALFFPNWECQINQDGPKLLPRRLRNCYK